MRNKLTYILLSCPLISSFYIYAQPHQPLPAATYTIHHVRVVDKENKPLNKATQAFIQQIVGVYAEQQITVPSPRFAQAAQALWKHGYVIELNAQIVEKGMLALQIVVLAHYPLINTISWKGISAKEKKNLSKKTNLSPGKPFLPHLQENIEEAIITTLQKKGYAKAKASLHVETLDDNHVNLHITIKKGTLYQLGRINFKLKKNFDFYALAGYIPYSREGTLDQYDAYYQRLIQNLIRQKFFLALQDLVRPFKFKNPLFIEEKLIEDIKCLEQAYLRKGYLDADITYSLHYKKRKVDIDFHITPRLQYVIKEVRWEGNVCLTDAQLNEGLGLSSGSVYDPLAIAQYCLYTPHAKNIHTLYQQHNAPVAVSAEIVVVGIKDNQVYLEGHIHETPHPQISQVNIHTGGKINKRIIEMILAEHSLIKGEILLPENIISCQRTLLKSGLFSPESIALIPSEKEAGQVNIDCYLIERRTSNYYFALRGYAFRLGIEEQNLDIQKLFKKKPPYGSGQQLAFDLSFENTKSAHLGISFTNPWFRIKGKRIPIGLQVVKKYHLNKNKGFQFTFHATQLFHKPHPSKYTHELIWGRQFLDSIRSLDTCVLKTAFYEDRTNDPLYPTAGSIRQGFLKGIQLLDNHTPWTRTYAQLMGKYTHFYTPKPDYPTLCYTITAGISPMTQENNPIGKFILGDSPFVIPKSNLVSPSLILFRGYQSEEPKRTYGISSPYYLAQSIELRYRVAQNICAILFCDTAITEKNFIATIGAEVRIHTPFCIVSLYAAFPLPKGDLRFYFRFMANNQPY